MEQTMRGFTRTSSGIVIKYYTTYFNLLSRKSRGINVFDIQDVLFKQPKNFRTGKTGLQYCEITTPNRAQTYLKVIR